MGETFKSEEKMILAIFILPFIPNIYSFVYLERNPDTPKEIIIAFNVIYIVSLIGLINWWFSITDGKVVMRLNRRGEIYMLEDRKCDIRYNQWLLEKSEDGKAFSIKNVDTKKFIIVYSDFVRMENHRSDYVVSNKSWFKIESVCNGYYIQSLENNKFLYISEDGEIIVVDNKSKLNPFLIDWQS